MDIAVTIYLTVDDPKAFAQAAQQRAREDGLTGRDVRQYNTTHLGDCARMLFDPGKSPPGCTIHDSSAEEG